MAYCVHCGNQVGETDVFCSRCGARQQSGGASAFAPPSGSPIGSSVTPRNVAMACYVPFIGWIASVYVIATQQFRQDRTTRFHAFQGLYLFVAWLMVDWFVGPFLRALPGEGFLDRSIPSLFKSVLLGASVFMLVKASQNEAYRLPLVGEWADKAVAEQR